MKEIIKKIIVWKLGFLAWMYLKRYKPMIIGVTGNVGKTSTRDAIAAVLAQNYTVKVGVGSINNLFGIPLTIVGTDKELTEYIANGGGTWFFWLKVILSGFLRLITTKKYPRVLVLEYGADRPGDIKKLATNFRPHISVVTAIGEIPVHVEYFSSPEELSREKSALVKNLELNDYAVLNYDDEQVLEMRSKTMANVVTYGFNPSAELRIFDFNFKMGGDTKPAGVVFKLNYHKSFVPVKMEGSLGKSQCWAAGAAASVGVILGMNLVEISDALSAYHGPAGRLKILKGAKSTTIIDDTYNASPSSTHLAVETISELSAKRKVAVLGDMLELGKYTIQAHQEIGNFAGGRVDILVCVGLRAKFIADAAANQMPSKNILTFETADEAKSKVQALIEEGDLILVKGSQGMRMEKIVEEIMAEPERKKELLVRQSKKWLNK